MDAKTFFVRPTWGKLSLLVTRRCHCDESTIFFFRFRIGYVAAGCMLIGFIAHLNSLDCGFCFDDLSAITENKDLRCVCGGGRGGEEIVM